jgi:hypothetical protein
MSSTIFASKKRKQNVAGKDDSDIEDGFADDSDANEGSGRTARSQKIRMIIRDSGWLPGEVFDISCTVNLESGDLADVLSEKGSPAPRKAIAKRPQPLSRFAAQKVLSEGDWEM